MYYVVKNGYFASIYLYTNTLKQSERMSKDEEKGMKTNTKKTKKGLIG